MCFQAVHDRSRCVFKLGKFTTMSDGLAATVKWAASGHFDAQEYAAHVATGSDTAAELTDVLDAVKGDTVEGAG